MKNKYILVYLTMLFSFGGQWVYAEDEDTPVVQEEIAGEKNLTKARPWRAPDFSQQTNALGWSETAFNVPKGLETQVKFWIDIYSKYNSDQGVLHDAEYIDLIYTEIDFTSISKRTDIDEFKKERMKKSLVKSEKEKIIRTLKILAKVKDPSDLTGDQKKYWDLFSQIDEKHKFSEAIKKNRLRFQLGQKDRMIQGIYFSGRYLEDFEKIFREAGIPMELTRLAFVESSFNVLARSKVGASGMWQIMPYTAKPYKMINLSIDKRNHPHDATKLATKLLKTNFSMLESWPLAVTGWNHGPTGILKLTKKYRTRELGDLVEGVTKKRSFGFASRNFYASFMAALEVERNAPKYLGNVTWSQPLDSVEITLPFAIKYKEIMSWFQGDGVKAQIFNPQITSLARAGRTDLAKGSVLAIPRLKLDEVMAALNDPSRQITKKAITNYAKKRPQKRNKKTSDELRL